MKMMAGLLALALGAMANDVCTLRTANTGMLLQTASRVHSQAQETDTKLDPVILDWLKKFRVCGQCTSMLSRVGDPLGGKAPPPFVDGAGTHKNDGGYLMCRDTTESASVAISIGINGWDGWGIQMSDEFKVPVHQYDCTNLRAPTCPEDRHCLMEFHGLCIDDGSAFFPSHQVKLLGDMVEQHAREGDNNLVLKIDCEGCEWGVFDNAPKELLSRFQTIVVEFHYLGNFQNYADISYKAPIMTKLLDVFHIVHTHECNFVPTADYGPYRIPTILEATLVRKDLVGEITCRSSPYLQNLDMRDRFESPDGGAASTILP